MNVADADKPRIEKLNAAHDVAGFDCGVAALNRFFQTYAMVNQKADSAQTYVALIGDVVVGYYSLTVGDVSYDDAPERLAKGLPHHPIPVMILARLAVDRKFHGRHIGAGLLLDVLRRILAAAEIAGIRGVVVHAKDDSAKAFYEHFGFVAFRQRPLTLYALLKDIRASRR